MKGFANLEMLPSLIESYKQRGLFLERRNINLYNSVFFQHASMTVPFYKSFFNNTAQANPIDFPIVSRKDLRKTVEFTSNNFDKKDLLFKTTSGTSGVPLKIPRDPASLYSFLHEGFAEVVSRETVTSKLMPGKLGILFVDDLGSNSEISNLNPSLNYSIVRRVSIGKDYVRDVQLVKELRKLRIPILYGRPRALQALMKIDESTNGRHISPDLGLCSGDNLYSDVKNSLQNWLQCRVLNSYAMQECGFIASECSNDTGLHISQNIMLNVEAGAGERSSTGEGFAVITYFDNWAFPIINYLTDDIVSVRNTSCRCGYSGPTITEIKGRNSPYFFIDGSQFNPSHFNIIFENQMIDQFQMVQRGHVFSLKVIPGEVKDLDFLASYLKDELRKIAPLEQIEIEFCRSIATDSHQKVQRYVCLAFT
ncbi:hypothetical protein EXU57_22910 [Segetibacter sp. 3557_3]|uniref:hypothetical protein n=1 Tax=Segetibacter sp. 3557_3 TaxID=2547429 RepID=UPI00105881C1|nr:hypothetical protein [Segetibacter sp. 3557_3]TDH18455.1 hypothetical protein EXU57_22910 [Segetibacter sp. 3557_3]